MDEATRLESARLLGAHDGSTRIAVVGASRVTSKFGYIITADLIGRGYTVLPVNPTEQELLGRQCLASVTEAQGPVHIVNFVVPARVTLETLRTLDPAAFPFVWFQPGSFDRACVTYARDRFPHVAEGDCIMVVAGAY